MCRLCALMDLLRWNMQWRSHPLYKQHLPTPLIYIAAPSLSRVPRVACHVVAWQCNEPCSRNKHKPSGEVAKSAYTSYIVNGMMTQLSRIEVGKNVEQTHMRNRKLICEWCYNKGLTGSKGKKKSEIVIFIAFMSWYWDGSYIVTILCSVNLNWKPVLEGHTRLTTFHIL